LASNGFLGINIAAANKRLIVNALGPKNMEVQMKTLNIKSVAVAAILLAIGPSAWSRDTRPADPMLMNNFPREHEAIRHDLERAQVHRGEIRCLKEELKADRRAGYKMDVAVDKREIANAKANLRDAKAQLREDKRTLKENYRIAIMDRKDEIRAKCRAHRSAMWDLEKTKRYGNQASIERDAAYVQRTEILLDASVVALADFKDERRVDMIAVNEDIRESSPKIAYIARSRDRDAYAGNCVVRY
jgi:hypothetical protein